MIKNSILMELNSKLPLFVTKADKGHGSFLTFNLANVLDSSLTDDLLWIYLCNWEIFSHEKSIITSHNINEYNKNKVVKLFPGKQLIEIKRCCFGILLSFEEKINIKLSKDEMFEKSDEWFMLYLHNIVYSYSDFKGFLQENADE